MKKLTYPNIEAERARNGYTVEELSKLLGVTRKTYYNWISAGKIPQTKIELMSDIFHTSTNYLLGI
ncbi:helix-turn-helix domain-containing protein [Ruminococcus sp.]|jgi:DNA-binding XRE family transcriptional regulator|uniref:helix-turn-helix domain-containing protein n=1 Tax=Ruminococcus sp. TaxID=41978 RepID=UPI003F7D40F3